MSLNEFINQNTVISGGNSIITCCLFFSTSRDHAPVERRTCKWRRVDDCPWDLVIGQLLNQSKNKSTKLISSGYKCFQPYFYLINLAELCFGLFSTDTMSIILLKLTFQEPQVSEADVLRQCLLVKRIHKRSTSGGRTLQKEEEAPMERSRGFLLYFICLC